MYEGGLASLPETIEVYDGEGWTGLDLGASSGTRGSASLIVGNEKDKLGADFIFEELFRKDPSSFFQHVLGSARGFIQFLSGSYDLTKLDRRAFSYSIFRGIDRRKTSVLIDTSFFVGAKGVVFSDMNVNFDTRNTATVIEDWRAWEDREYGVHIDDHFKYEVEDYEGLTLENCNVFIGSLPPSRRLYGIKFVNCNITFASFQGGFPILIDCEFYNCFIKSGTSDRGHSVPEFWGCFVYKCMVECAISFGFYNWFIGNAIMEIRAINGGIKGTNETDESSFADYFNYFNRYGYSLSSTHFVDDSNETFFSESNEVWSGEIGFLKVYKDWLCWPDSETYFYLQKQHTVMPRDDFFYLEEDEQSLYPLYKEGYSLWFAEYIFRVSDNYDDFII